MLTSQSAEFAAIGEPLQIAVSGHDQYVAWKQAGTWYSGIFGFLVRQAGAAASAGQVADGI
jgi:hypothetical protein